MTNKQLRAEAKEIVFSIGGIDVEETIDLYDAIVELAEQYAFLERQAVEKELADIKAIPGNKWK